MGQGHPRDASKSLREAVRDARGLLKNLKAFGVTTVPLKKTAPPKTSKNAQLEPLRQKALQCQACRLHEKRTSVVFGEGNLDAALVFVGEGPGREEDLQGRPFVGAAGGLLTKIIQAMELQREQVYITNVVKCRPPMNRPPEPDEVAACSGFLEFQLKTIRPKVICALGKTAATALLKTEEPMSRLRGKQHSWEGIPLVVTFHPAYLLRNPAAKPLVWQDMQQVLSLLKSR